MLAKSLTNIESTVETTDSTIAPKIAGSQPSTMKPGTNREVSLKTMALTINMKSPKVIIVKGNVSKSSSGLIKVLMTPRTMAAKSAEVKESTLKPGTM